MKDAMEKQIERLTLDLLKRCAGKGAAVAVGAGLNVAMTAAQQIPDKAIREGFVFALRHMADSLEVQNSKVRQ